jgi:hypothetical protein
MLKTRYITLAVLAGLSTGARAEHQTALQSTNTNMSGPPSGSSLSMPSSGKFQKRDGGGGGPTYQKNPTTQELAKAAQAYQQQMNDATKAEMSSVKDMTSSFLSSLDKLKVPEAGGDMLKSAADNIAQIGKDDTGTQKKVDDLIAATKAQGDTQVEFMKAVAQAYSPNGGPPQARQTKAQGPTEAQLLEGFRGGRSPASGSSPLGMAMGTQPSGSGSAGPALGGGGGRGGGAPAPQPRADIRSSDQTYNPPAGIH